MSGSASRGPTVINRHHFKGRPMPRPWVYIGRGTPLGNPFTVAEHGEQALPRYRRWLWDRIRESDPRVLEALRGLTPRHHLVCSCAPRPCHGDVVVAAWHWLVARDSAPNERSRDGR